MDTDLSTPTSDFYFSPLVIKDEEGTVLHRIEQTELGYWNEQDLALSKVLELADPIGIEFPTNKQVFVDIDVWDYDDGATSNSDNDFVRSMDNMAVPFSGKQAGEDWTEVEYSNTDGDGQASLIFKYKIFECDKGFSGAGCNSCAEGWTGESCSECAEGWTGESCSECAENYYPAGQCTKFCEPEANKYTCTSEGDKECLENYYPAGQCTKFCEPEANKYTCTSEGDKECLENYYPAGQCTKFCEPETNKHVCTSEGEMQCAEDFYGDDCSQFCQDSDSYVCSEEGSL